LHVVSIERDSTSAPHLAGTISDAPLALASNDVTSGDEKEIWKKLAG
jgi:hypothetical protein